MQACVCNVVHIHVCAHVHSRALMCKGKRTSISCLKTLLFSMRHSLALNLELAVVLA